MKSHPENNLAPVASTSRTEVDGKRKILLFVTDFECGRLILRHLKEIYQSVVETVDDVDLLLHEIARTNPHLLVAYTPVESVESPMDLKQLHLLFPNLPVCFLSGELSDTRWQHQLQEALEKPIKPETPRPYADGSRYVYHDASLRGYWKGKLNRPKREKGWEKVCSAQEAHFLMQLQTGRIRHEEAIQYYHCLLAQQAGLDQELAYRCAHGSYKALSWSRDLAVKWLALLAHYIPDTDLEFLPKAGTPGPAVDFVHHDMTDEGVYAATLIILSKVKPAMIEAIKQLVSARFDGQHENELLSLSLQMYGLAKVLQQVGTAQIELMDAWLDPSIVDRVGDDNNPRGEHRNAGLYRDFFNLGFIIHSPEPLAAILKGFHAGTTYVQHERFLPSFSEFRYVCQKVFKQDLE